MQPDDPTFMRNQPVMRGGSVAWWLIPAGLLGAISVTLFAFSIPIASAVAWTGILVEVALFIAMCLVAAAVRSGRTRGMALAALMCAMALAAVVLLLVVYTVAAADPSGSSTSVMPVVELADISSAWSHAGFSWGS